MPPIEDCTVVRTRKDIVYIELVQNAKCAGCKACAFGRGGRVVLPAYSDVECRAGDFVRVRMPLEEVKFAAFFLYVIPLVLLLAGLLAGLPLGEGFMALFAAVFTALGFAVAFLIDKAYRRKRKFMPTVLEKIQNGKENTDD